jgi:cytoskeleton protein RodZ
MTAMHDDGQRPDGAAPVTAGAPGAGAPLDSGGDRLRQVREASGLERDEFARKAHIPAGVLADLEAGRFDRLGASVFVRGYLRSFARAAGLADDALLDVLPPAGDPPPPLVVQRVAPATPRWVTRYATPVAYALLTAVVMVPLVYLARPTAQQVAQAPSLTPIDATGRAAALPPVAPDSAAAEPVAIAARVGAEAPLGPDAFAGPPAPPAGSEPAARPSPVMASLAPLPQVAAPSGPRRVTLRLAASSWVEFTGADGSRLEYALLPAGTVRDYQLQGSAVLMIGNASEAQLTVDGRVVDLRPLSSGNDVARVRLGDDPAASD